MHLTTDVTTDDNYKAWVVMQASEPLGLSKYKRTQVLMNESQKKKQKRHSKWSHRSSFSCYAFPFSTMHCNKDNTYNVQTKFHFNKIH